MALVLHGMSGSPYVWRVWLALVHKGIPHEVRMLSPDAGDLRQPGFTRLTPRRRVPVIEDEGFVLYESAAIVEYLEEKWPDPRLFDRDLRRRAVQRRLIREADQYVAEALEHLVQAVFYTAEAERSADRIGALWQAMRQELAMWEGLIEGEYLAGELSAADHALFPEIMLGYRIRRFCPGMTEGDLPGPRLAAWMARMRGLEAVQRTWPPHWEGGV